VSDDESTRSYEGPRNVGRTIVLGGVYIDPVNRARHLYLRGDIEVGEFERQVWTALNEVRGALR
jgi:hypothetical protein